MTDGGGEHGRGAQINPGLGSWLPWPFEKAPGQHDLLSRCRSTSCLDCGMNDIFPSEPTHDRDSSLRQERRALVKRVPICCREQRYPYDLRDNEIQQGEDFGYALGGISYQRQDQDSNDDACVDHHLSCSRPQRGRNLKSGDRTGLKQVEVTEHWIPLGDTVMHLSEALDRKTHFLQRYTAAYVQKEYKTITQAAIAEAIAASGPADRLAIGISTLSEGLGVGNTPPDFRLELRVQRTDGPAFREARRIMDEVRGEGRIRILPRIEFPSFAALLESMRTMLRFDDENSPLQIGDPVRCRRAGAGTLGGFTTTSNGPGFLSSSHVMAAHASGSRPTRGDPIYRPRRRALSIRSGSEVGSLTHWNELDAATGNYIDAAFSELNLSQPYIGNIIPSADDIPLTLRGKRLKALPAADYEDISAQFAKTNYELIGMPVAKIGAATGYTQGMISAALLDGITAYVPWLGNVAYINVFEIQPKDTEDFTSPGDSGAAVFILPSNTVIGLHFASSDALDEDGQKLGFRVSYACSIQSILYEFSRDGYAWM